MAFIGFVLTMGGVVITVKWVAGQADRWIGKSLRGAFTPPKL